MYKKENKCIEYDYHERGKTKQKTKRMQYTLGHRDTFKKCAILRWDMVIMVKLSLILMLQTAQNQKGMNEKSGPSIT